MSESTYTTFATYDGYQIPILTKDNWYSYKARALAIGDLKGFSQFLEPPSKTPIPRITVTSPPTTSSKEKSSDSKDGEDDLLDKNNLENEKKARGFLMLTVSDELMLHIRGLRDSKEIWNTLVEICKPRGIVAKWTIERKIKNWRYEDGEDIRKHVDQLKSWNLELATMGVKMDDSDFISHIINSLPESWFPWINSFMGSQASKSSDINSYSVTPSDFTRILYEQYDRVQSQKESAEVALLAKRQNQNKSKSNSKQSKKDLSDIECFNCKKKGHYKSDCWAPGGGKEGKGPKGEKKDGEKANIVESKDEKGEEEKGYMIDEYFDFKEFALKAKEHGSQSVRSSYPGRKALGVRLGFYNR
jgi:hypothetical protein